MTLTASSLTCGVLTLTPVGGWRSTGGLGVGEGEGGAELGAVVKGSVTTGEVETATGVLDGMTGILVVGLTSPRGLDGIEVVEGSTEAVWLGGTVVEGEGEKWSTPAEMKSYMQ